MSNKTSTKPHGTIHILCGRGRTGKSTWARWAAERASLAGRPLIVVDGDRNNSTLASFVSDARRPTHANDETVTAFLEETTAEVVQNGGNALIDMGGGDRIFSTVAAQHNFFKVLPQFGVELICYHFAAGGRDDFETLVRMNAIGLMSRRTVIVLNEGLSAPAANERDPFASLLEGRTVSQTLESGGRVVRMPAVPMATMSAADGLFIGIRAASEGKVPCGDDGQPHPLAKPLMFWRRMELRAWLATMEDRHRDAAVAEWLP